MAEEKEENNGLYQYWYVLSKPHRLVHSRQRCRRPVKGGPTVEGLGLVSEEAGHFDA